jgi:hypothetical protein
MYWIIFYVAVYQYHPSPLPSHNFRGHVFVTVAITLNPLHIGNERGHTRSSLFKPGVSR